jgi:hypothetical protein
MERKIKCFRKKRRGEVIYSIFMEAVTAKRKISRNEYLYWHDYIIKRKINLGMAAA